MKFPFAKKSGGYYVTIKNKLTEAVKELDAARQALELEKANEQSARINIEQAKQRMHRDPDGAGYDVDRFQEILTKSANQVGIITNAVDQMDKLVRELQIVVDAPRRFDEAKALLHDTINKRKASADNKEKIRLLIEKIENRISKIELDIVAESNKATNMLIDSGGEVCDTGAIATLEIELRLAKTSLSDLHMKRDALQDEENDLSNNIEQANREFIHARAGVIEIDLLENLQPEQMALFARVALARHQIKNSSPEDKLELSIPVDMIELARAELEAAVPTV